MKLRPFTILKDEINGNLVCEDKTGEDNLLITPETNKTISGFALNLVFSFDKRIRHF